jgi:hypothetical protein
MPDLLPDQKLWRLNTLEDTTVLAKARESRSVASFRNTVFINVPEGTLHGSASDGLNDVCAFHDESQLGECKI